MNSIFRTTTPLRQISRVCEIVMPLTLFRLLISYYFFSFVASPSLPPRLVLIVSFSR